MTSPDLIALCLALVLLFVLLRSFVGRAVPARATPEPTADTPPVNAILVDGSNVMHWGGAPSASVLDRILRDLQDRGHTPIVVFDASAGYRLQDRYLNGPQLAHLFGLPVPHVYVVNKGVVADEVILDLAQTHNLRIVTNDRYRDWRVQFPLVGKKGALVQGTWKQGSVVWKHPF